MSRGLTRMWGKSRSSPSWTTLREISQGISPTSLDHTPVHLGGGGGGGGVTFNKTEERCSRSSPLTFTGVLNAPVQGEGVERARKRKRVASELPREAALAAKEEPKTEKMEGGGGGGGGGFEDYPEELVLSPRDEEEMPAHNRVEREMKRAKEQESNASELLSLLTEMRKDLKRRDEQFREELRWRDETLATKNKRREENLAAVLQ